MRKALIAVIVASALFAVGAFAADLTVNSEDIASGSNAVVACAAEVDIDFTTQYDNADPTVVGGEVTATNGDWTVPSATVRFYDSTGTLTAACAGFGANLAVMTGTAGAPAATGIATVQTGQSSVTVTLTPGTLKASQITGAAVLIDGQTLEDPSPGQGFPSP